MAAYDRDFSVDGVYAFLANNGGKVTSGELAKHFRKYLIDPMNEGENKILFKEFVNYVAVQKRIEGENFVVLKSRTNDQFLQDVRERYNSANNLHSKCESLDIDAGTVKHLTNAIESRENDNHSESKSQVSDQSADKESEYLITDDQCVVVQPVAPPRRRHNADKENRSSENSDHIESQSDSNEESPRVVSVKEQAQKLNKIVSESQLVLHPHNAATAKKFHREMRFDRNTDDEDSSSVTSLDAQSKEWIVNAAKCNYQDLVKLLKQNPSLARQEDISSGYNALHWAAKHGNDNVIKLIAGTHGIPVNTRSFGGYTPLHLAAMFKRKETYNLLVSTYHANVNMRDYSGKRAEDYFEVRKQRQAHGGPTYKEETSQRRGGSRRNSDNNNSGFLRLGSFNVKVKKTAESLGHIKNKSTSTFVAQKLHKGWGSADNIPGKEDELAMPPPPPAKVTVIHRSHKNRKSHLATRQAKSDVFY